MSTSANQIDCRARLLTAETQRSQRWRREETQNLRVASAISASAIAGFLELVKLHFDRHHLGIGRFLAVPVARSTGGNRNVGSKSAQSARPGNIDVAGGALHHMFAFAAFMAEFSGLARRPVQRDKRSRRLVASVTVIVNRLLTFPVTIEAGIVRARPGFESSGGRREGIRQSRRDVLVRHVADRTIVVISFRRIV